MKGFMYAALCVLCFGTPLLAARAQIAEHIVISEVYGGGGNLGAAYKNDFVELYNPTDLPVSISGWSIQYASGSGTGTWQVLPLRGTVQPFAFYLIQMAGGINGNTLPFPDTMGTINLSASSGKVALVRATIPLTGASPGDTAIVDRVGYGTANGFEGTGSSPAPGIVTSIERKAHPDADATTMSHGGPDELQGNGWDSEDNSVDFVAQTGMNPQNRTSPSEEPPKDPPPVVLGSFTGTVLSPGVVRLSWTTISEMKCYGFEVQNSADRTDGFTTISPLIPAYGTTVDVQYYSYTDSSGTQGPHYRLKLIALNQIVHFSDVIAIPPLTSVAEKRPLQSFLHQNYPNPFNPSTNITYVVSAEQNVRLEVFDMLGRVVATLVNGRRTPGVYSVPFPASDLGSGSYFYTLTAGSFRETKRMLLVR